MFVRKWVLWPSGLVHWTQVLVLPECGFESRPGRSRALVSLSKTLNHNCFILRMGRKAVGPVCCVMRVKEPRTLYRAREGACPGVSGFAPWAPSRVDMCALQILSLLLLLLNETWMYTLISFRTKLETEGKGHLPRSSKNVDIDRLMKFLRRVINSLFNLPYKKCWGTFVHSIFATFFQNSETKPANIH